MLLCALLSNSSKLRGSVRSLALALHPLPSWASVLHADPPTGDAAMVLEPGAQPAGPSGPSEVTFSG